ncbi:MAG TPA: ImcF-related family protein [Bryobacteraceae bacterium]|nr:ImcF-related family protein [Bryobacteraceae bacterium]
MIAIGHIGKYELLESLGGGMSHVYRAQDTVLGRTVAIKVLSEAGCADPEAKARFLAEARLASSFSHENVLGIYDFGEDEQHRPYMVMEFLRGETLHTAIQNGETGDLGNKLRIALQTARALEYLHSRNVIHRDVKPDNIYLNLSGAVKVMDFGIAKTEGINMTRAGFVLGTPGYMAPEQVRGEKLSGQVDVYGFGMLLFELLTGAKAISGDTLERILYLILNEPLDLSPLTRSGASEAVCDLIARCTAKIPTDRPHGFGPVCAALEEMLAAPGSRRLAAPQAQAKPAAPRKRRTLAKWLAAAVLALLVVCAGLVWQGYFELNARIRSAARAIPAAGDGRPLSARTLAQFDRLRTELEKLDRYRRQGAPPGYRLGSLLRGDLYRSTRGLYFGLFQSFFLGPVQRHQVQFLRGLAASPGAAYGPVYETLKAYLMTTSEPAKADARFLLPVLVRWWASNGNPGSDSEVVARRQFEYYAAQLSRDDPFPRDNDNQVVLQARRHLSQFAGADRTYALLLAEAAKQSPALNFNRQFPGSGNVLTEAFEVPGSFSKAGWNFVNDAVSRSHFAGESWVAGESGAATDEANTAERVTGRYQKDFINAWRLYLRGGTFIPFANPADAAQKLDGLARENSVLERWLSLAALHTAVDVAAVSDVFRSVRDAVAAAPRYRVLMAGLSSALRGVAVPGAASAQATALVEQDLKTTTQMVASFHGDPGGHAEAQVVRMLDEPILGARAVLRSTGFAEWNARGSDLCSRMEPVLSKYPFTPEASAQASAGDIIALFRPGDGMLWKFYNEWLDKLIQRDGEKFIANASTGFTVNPAFLSFLNNAAAFSGDVFAGSASQPRFRYTIRPVMSPAVESVKLAVDGQNATFRANTAARTFTWTGTAILQMRVNVKFKGKGEYNWSKPGTPWAMLMFFDASRRRQGAQIEVSLLGNAPLTPGQPASLWFEVSAVPPVFNAGYFSSLACVAEVVKPSDN